MKNIKACIKGDPSKREAIIPSLLFSLRKVLQASTECSPFEKVYGHKPRRLLDIVCESWLEQKPGNCKQSWDVVDFRERLEKVRNITQDHLEKIQVKQKRAYDERMKERELKEGELVHIMLPDNTHKLLAWWQGPFQITRRLGPVNYEALRTEPIKRKQKLPHQFT